MEHTGQMERDEQEFGPRLGRMLDAYADVPAPDLVSGGLARGRRLKRRRQTLWSAAVFTVATGVTGAVVLTGMLPGNSTGGTKNQATVTIPDFSLTAGGTSAPDGKVAVTGKATVGTLRDLLPGKPATSGYQWWESKEGADTVSAGGRLLTSGGKAETTVSLQGNFQLTAFDALSKDAARAAAEGSAEQDKSGQTAPDKSAAAKEATGSASDKTGTEKKVRPATEAELKTFYSCADRAAAGANLSSCSARNLADGSVLISYEERTGTLTRRTADLLRKDGTRIVLVTANSTDGKRGPADIAAPPLTLAQLAAIAENADWQPWVDPAVNDGAKSIA
ncbi:hypothetical protein [Streptomyces fulvoviolaceus]|uniref:hypothetical protein n=1 Tax=Streptomyces fulvoviolaceus TaxID=285535 RepID=UPI0004C9FAA0|nr:hypothetical protein [Streptomyces fulvoviolaceus]